MNYRIASSLLLLLFVCASPAQAKMYKWVDEQGNVHFGDRVPNQYLTKEHKELNDQGAVVETHDAIVEETPEQKQERYRLEQAQKQEQKKAEEQAKQDRVLLDTYTTERDLLAARDARLEAVDSQLQLSESIIGDAERTLELTAKQVTQIRASGREVPQNIVDKMENEEKQLKTHREVAASHQQRKQEINKQFEAYINRFRELKANQQRIRDEREARRKEAMGL